MQFRVEKAFFDRITGAPYNAGSIYESDDPERIAELQNGGYLPSKKIEQVTTDESTQEQTGATERTKTEIPSITETTKPEQTESVVTETPVTNETVTHTDVTPVTEQIVTPETVADKLEVTPAVTNEMVTDNQEETPSVTTETVMNLNVTETTIENRQVQAEISEAVQDGNLETIEPAMTETIVKDDTTKNSRRLQRGRSKTVGQNANSNSSTGL